MKSMQHHIYIPHRVFILPLAALFWNQLLYQGAAKLAASRFHYDFSLPLDHKIPLIPWTITIYFGCYVLWVSHYIWMAWRDDQTATQFYTADFLSKLLSLAFFLFLPTVMDRPEVTGPDFWSDAIRFLYHVDKPFNLFPSLHCSISWLCWISVRKDDHSPSWYRWLTLAVTVAVCASTLTTRQHVLVDVAGGILTAEICWTITRAKTVLHQIII